MNTRPSSRRWMVDLETKDSFLSIHFGAWTSGSRMKETQGSGAGQQHTNMTKFSHRYSKFRRISVAEVHHRHLDASPARNALIAYVRSKFT